jgi:hypothetical protein
MRERIRDITSIRPAFLSAAVILSSAALVAAGWTWMYLAVSAFQKEAGATFLQYSPRSAHYEFWGWSLPMNATANFVVVCALISLFVLWRRREFFLFTALAGYFTFLAMVAFFLFLGLGLRVFG